MKEEKQTPAAAPAKAREEKLPEGAYKTRHGNIVKNGTEAVRSER